MTSKPIQLGQLAHRVKALKLLEALLTELSVPYTVRPYQNYLGTTPKSSFCVDIEHPEIEVTVRIYRPHIGSDHCLAWCTVGRIRMRTALFPRANPYHFGKSTEFYSTFEEVLERIRTVFAAVAANEAFQ